MKAAKRCGHAIVKAGGAWQRSATMFEWIEDELEKFGGLGLLREPSDGLLRAVVAERAVKFGKQFIDASSNDYLGYGRRCWDRGWMVSRETFGGRVLIDSNSATAKADSETQLAAPSGQPPPDADDTAGACASRLLGGTRPVHTQLEETIAEWLGHETALLFSSGYAANVGVLSSLAGASDVIFSDALNHASIIDGCRLSRATVVAFRHCDEGSLRELLTSSTSARRRFVITESYFSMDGDSPDLASLRALCDEFQATLIVDEAHALGIFGPQGAGLAAQSGVVPDIVIGTLGKALGLQGAFVAGPQLVQRWLWNRARSFVYSTAPVPPLARMALLHVKQIRADEARRRIVIERARALRKCINELGFPMPIGSHGPIVPVILRENQSAIAAAHRLRTLGILAYPLRPPTVPAGTARLRLTVAADTADPDFQWLLDCVRTSLREFALDKQ